VESWRALKTHFAGKITEKRQNFDPSTRPASAENLHFALNRETRRAPGLAVAHATSRPHPDSLGRCGQGELCGTVILPQTILGQSSIAP
jgi:hypothetical protein